MIPPSFSAGRNAAELGDTDAALALLERAAHVRPIPRKPSRVLADLLSRRGTFPAALEHYNRAVALDPDDLEARHGRGLVLTRLGKTDEASADQIVAVRLRADLNVLTTAQTRLLTSPRDRDAQLTVTRWLFAHGKATEAIRWAESILHDQPDQPDACRLLANHYQQTGQPGLANYYRAQAAETPGESNSR